MACAETRPHASRDLFPHVLHHFCASSPLPLPPTSDPYAHLLPCFALLAAQAHPHSLWEADGTTAADSETLASSCFPTSADAGSAPAPLSHVLGMHAGFTAAASINVSILISLIALCACVAALLPSALYYLLPQRSLCWAAGLSALKSSKMIVTMMLLLFLHPEQAVSGVKVSRVAITSTVSPPVNASFTSQLADAKLGGTHLTLLWEAATAFDSSEICAPLLHHEREQEGATRLGT